MYYWLFDYLDLDIRDIYVGRKENNEILGGYIKTSKEKFQICNGIPKIFPSRYYRKLKRVINAYRNIDPFTWSSKKSDWIKHLRKIHATIILRGLSILDPKKSLNILSIGCGWGWEILLISKYLSNKNVNFRLIGCDIALKPLFIAKRFFRKNKNIDFVCCPAEYLPFRSESFDFITAVFGSLDHSIFYNKTFMYISKVLKHNGVFVGTVLNRFALDWILKVITNYRLFLKTIKYADKTHARIRIPSGKRYIRIPTHFYSWIELRRILKKFGLEVIWRYGIFSLLPPNFKKNKFSRLEYLLSRVEHYLGSSFLIRDIGRYIGFIAIKA